MEIHDIEVTDDKPKRIRPYRMSKRQEEILGKEIKGMLELNIIKEGESDYYSPMILVESEGKDPRPCIDYRRLNAVTKVEYYPSPNIEERVERVSAAKYITMLDLMLDLTKGYWQIPMTPRAQKLAAFVTNSATFSPLKMPFGFSGASRNMLWRGLAYFRGLYVPRSGPAVFLSFDLMGRAGSGPDLILLLT